MARTQEDRKAETRSRLLAVAAELFAQGGYDAVSVEAIGEAADRTSGSVYAHFGGKQGILLALLEGFQSDVQAVVDAESLLHKTLQGRLAGLWRNLTDHPNDRAEHFLLLEIELWLHSARDAELAVLLGSRYGAARPLVAALLRAWSDEFGLTPTLADDELAVAFIAMLAGLLLQHRVDPGLIDEDFAAACLAGVVGHDLRSASPPKDRTSHATP